MSTPAITVEAQTPVSDALETMRHKNISSLIVNPTGPDDAYGIFTKRDIITKVVARDLDPNHLLVSEIMSKPVLTISPKTGLRECSILMSKAGIRRLPVVDGDKLVGVISDTDIFQCVEERGWGPETETKVEPDPFLNDLRARVRAQLSQKNDPDAITSAIMLGLGELYRLLKR